MERPEIAFIGDADSVQGFRALGVEALVPESAEEAVRLFRERVRNGTAVILVVEDLLDALGEEIAATAEAPLPAVVVVPGISGGQGRAGEVIRRMVIRAVGVDLGSDEEA